MRTKEEISMEIREFEREHFIEDVSLLTPELLLDIRGLLVEINNKMEKKK